MVVSKPQIPDERALGEETSIPEGPQHQGGISKKITTKKEEINPCVPCGLWRCLGELLQLWGSYWKGKPRQEEG